MIKIDPNKTKILKFKVNVEGIDPQVLEYNLRLSDGNIDYGFKGNNKNGDISFTIPPLKEVISSSNIKTLKEIKLEVNDKNNKYYLKPFEDEVKIEEELKVEAKLYKDNTVREDRELKVSASISEEKDEEKKIENKQKKTTKLGKFLVE